MKHVKIQTLITRVVARLVLQNKINFSKTLSVLPNDVSNGTQNPSHRQYKANTSIVLQVLGIFPEMLSFSHTFVVTSK